MTFWSQSMIEPVTTPAPPVLEAQPDDNIALSAVSDLVDAYLRDSHLHRG